MNRVRGGERIEVTSNTVIVLQTYYTSFRFWICQNFRTLRIKPNKTVAHINVSRNLHKTLHASIRYEVEY